MMICRSESASIPPADFRLYNATRKRLSGKQTVPLFLSTLRKPRDGASRREVKPRMQKGTLDEQKYRRASIVANDKPEFFL